MKSFHDYMQDRQRVDEGLWGMTRFAPPAAAPLVRNLGAGAVDATKSAANLAVGIPTTALGMIDKTITGDNRNLHAGVSRTGRGLAQAGAAMAHVAGSPFAAVAKTMQAGRGNTPSGGAFKQFYGLARPGQPQSGQPQSGQPQSGQPQSGQPTNQSHQSGPFYPRATYQRLLKYVDDMGPEGANLLSMMRQDVVARLQKLPSHGSATPG